MPNRELLGGSYVRTGRPLGTAVRYWFECQLIDIFGVDVRPTATTADAICDQIAEHLALPTFRPRALFHWFAISVLATTDDPCDDPAGPYSTAGGPGLDRPGHTNLPPRSLFQARCAELPELIARLGEVANVGIETYAEWVVAMEQRRSYFIAHDATSTDHSHADVGTEPLDTLGAERRYAAALAGTIELADEVALRHHMLSEMARMATQDGLVMTLHRGIRRNHHGPTFDRFGSDTGHDIPLSASLTDALRPLRQSFGIHPSLRLILFTLDESVFSRELAPLAGFYPSVYVKDPWWLLHAPHAVRRYREAATGTVGFLRMSGFIDDTRAFCSIPAPHDMSRRLDSGYLAQLMAEHRLDEDETAETAIDLAVSRPKEAIKL